MVSIGSAIKAGAAPKAAKRPGSANPPLVTPPANRVQLPSVPANSPNSGPQPHLPRLSLTAVPITLSQMYRRLPQPPVRLITERDR